MELKIRNANGVSLVYKNIKNTIFLDVVFRRNVLPPSSGMKSKINEIPSSQQ
jgi:hypothetical protein